MATEAPHKIKSSRFEEMFDCSAKSVNFRAVLHAFFSSPLVRGFLPPLVATRAPRADRDPPWGQGARSHFGRTRAHSLRNTRERRFSFPETMRPFPAFKCSLKLDDTCFFCSMCLNSDIQPFSDDF